MNLKRLKIFRIVFRCSDHLHKTDSVPGGVKGGTKRCKLGKKGGFLGTHIEAVDSG